MSLPAARSQIKSETKIHTIVWMFNYEVTRLDSLQREALEKSLAVTDAPV